MFTIYVHMTTRCRYLKDFLMFSGLLLTFMGSVIPAFGQSAVSNTDHALEIIVSRADSMLRANNIQGFRIDFSHPTAVRLKLIDALLERGYRIYEMPTETTEITTLSIDPMLVYRYAATSRSSGIRNVEGSVGITLIRRDGSVIGTHLAQIETSETVNVSAVALDDGLWPMAAFASIGQVGRKRTLKRILEPALLITTVGVTVFLLFNVRSQ